MMPDLSNIKISAGNIEEVLRRITKNEREPDPLFLVVDLFCGAGGTTTGFDRARLNGHKMAKVIACVNHDPVAILSHWRNHPDVLHFEEDIRTLDVIPLAKLVAYYRKLYPNAIVILWASLECTNFSKAKGGLPRDGDSRTLADHLHRYVTAINPDYIQIENVVEFMSWGPLDENGKPVSKKSGIDFMRWRGEMCAHGYTDENGWKELNSANFGAHTSRNRLFGCFARHGNPIAWPEATHAKKPVEGSMFSAPLQKWRAVKEVLNFEDEGISIFTRKKELSEKTLERIFAGLVKYIANGDKAFISKYFSGRPAGKVSGIDSPHGVIRTKDGAALINVQDLFLHHYYTSGGGHSSIDKPCPVVTNKARTSLIQGEFFLDKHFGTAQNQSIHQPAGVIMPNDKHRLVECTPFIMDTQYNNKPQSTEDPLNVITADGHYHYLVNPAWGGNPGSVEDPCCTVVARQDKAPLYMVSVSKKGERSYISEQIKERKVLYWFQHIFSQDDELMIAVYDTDSEVMVKIKQFMAIYGLVDIKMRMLRVPELLRIQGFPPEYVLEGTQADQKRFIGNSVVPHVVKDWCEAMGTTILKKLKAA